MAAGRPSPPAAAGTTTTTTAQNHHVLIVGATGLLGRAVVDHFSSLAGWAVSSIARRPLQGVHRSTHYQVDLTDSDLCDRVLRTASCQLRGVTQIIYTALYGSDVWDEGERRINLAMLQNVLQPMLAIASNNLQRVDLMQGRKAYPSQDLQHWPAKEQHTSEDGSSSVSDQTAVWRNGKSWYFDQQKYVSDQSDAAGGRWSWTAWRPPAVIGFAPGAPLSCVAAVGAHAVIMRELGQPLAFPGGVALAKQACDVRVLARAFEWAGTGKHPAARNTALNITNGDTMVWTAVYPRIAKLFRMEYAAAQPMKLAEEMPRYSAVWEKIVEKYRLRQLSLRDLVGDSWGFTDNSMGGWGVVAPDSSSPDHLSIGVLLSTIKLMQAGFHTVMDSEDSVLYWLRYMQEQNYLPTY
eukprot:COSAG01_NODE_2850_length_6977_cov_8.906077_4_plen_408_part_00